MSSPARWIISSGQEVIVGDEVALEFHPDEIGIGVVPLDCDRYPVWTAELFWMFDANRVTVELISGHLTIIQPQEIAVYGAAARTLIANAIAATAVRVERDPAGQPVKDSGPKRPQATKAVRAR